MHNPFSNNISPSPRYVNHRKPTSLPQGHRVLPFLPGKYPLICATHESRLLSMRIYALADIHGKKENIEILSWASNEFKPDIIVIAGDITNYFHWKSTLDQLDRLGAKISSPILCIRGNSDFKRVERGIAKAKNLTLLDASPHYFQDVPFMGANGTIPLPFASRICLRENRLLKTLLPRNKEAVLVVHPPPRGMCDQVGNRFSAGSGNLLNFVETTQPRMVICGHIHEQAGMKFVTNCIPGTLVVNCAMNKDHHGAIIDLEKGTIPLVKFLHP